MLLNITMKVLNVVGARPNFVKAAPIHLAFRRAGIKNDLFHTGQHYDEAMSKVFFEDLGMPRPIIDRLKGDPFFAPLRSDPRYTLLLRRMNL